MKKAAVFLPYYNIPKRKIEINGNPIVPVTLLTLEKHYYSHTYNLRPVDLLKLPIIRYGRKFEPNTAEWSILELPTFELPEYCYSVIFDLIHSHWKHYLNWHTEKTPPLYNWDRRSIREIESIIILAQKFRRFQISLMRWGTSYTRQDPLDAILDCCSSIEAIMSCKDEIRLRISLASYQIVKRNKRKVMKTVYEMYGIRNEFIHGSKIPEVNHQDVIKYIEVTSNIILSIPKNRNLPKVDELSSRLLNKL